MPFNYIFNTLCIRNLRFYPFSDHDLSSLENVNQITKL